MTLARRAELAVTSAREADLDDIEGMIHDFVKGHPAETHSRSRAKLREPGSRTPKGIGGEKDVPRRSR